MAKSKQYTKLLDKRSNAIRALTFHNAPVNELDVSSSRAGSYATTTLPLIEASFEKCKKTTETLEDHDEFEYDDLEPKEEKVTEMYVSMATKLREILNESNANASQLSASNASNENHMIQDLKLPALEIPQFSGKFEEWTTFYDTFQTYVDSSSIPDVNKMHFLKKSLTGTAYSMIKNLPASNENYKIAWSTLCERYHNKRAIVNSCLRVFMNQLPIEKPNAHKLRELLDTTNQAIQCIETLSVVTEHWDPILVYIIQTKLDKNTLKE